MEANRRQMVESAIRLFVALVMLVNALAPSVAMAAPHNRKIPIASHPRGCRDCAICFALPLIVVEIDTCSRFHLTLQTAAPYSSHPRGDQCANFS